MILVSLLMEGFKCLKLKPAGLVVLDQILNKLN